MIETLLQPLSFKTTSHYQFTDLRRRYYCPIGTNQPVTVVPTHLLYYPPTEDNTADEILVDSHSLTHVWEEKFACSPSMTSLLLNHCKF